MNRTGSCDRDPCRYWVGTATYTAECPAGKTGDPVTVTRQFRSTISEKHAITRARELAKREAELELVCQFEATQCWQPPCGGTFYPPVCRTAHSTVSQQEAKHTALTLAKTAAEALCH